MTDVSNDEGSTDGSTEHGAWRWWALSGGLAVLIVILVLVAGGGGGGEDKSVRADGSPRADSSRSEDGDDKAESTASSTTTTTATTTTTRGATSAAGSGGSGGSGSGGSGSGPGGGAPGGGGAPPDTTGPQISSYVNPEVMYVSGCGSASPREGQVHLTVSDPSGLASYSIYGTTYPLAGQTNWTGASTVSSSTAGPSSVSFTATDTRGNSTTIVDYFTVVACP